MSYRPSKLRQLLHELDIRPNKQLSQNFLIDGNIVRKIVAAAEVEPQGSVLEIGPGPGAFTDPLLATGAAVVAVEKDHRLARSLQRLQTSDNRLTVISDDIRQFELSSLPHNTIVVANLPYHLTTPILARLLPQYRQLKRIVVIVQEEVARRLCATHGNKEYSSLSVFAQLQSTTRYLFKVNRRCFYPVPRVDSAVVQFDLTPPPIEPAEALFQLTRMAFGVRRKMLKNALSNAFPPATVTATLSAMGLRADARAEALSPADFVNLYRRLLVSDPTLKSEQKQQEDQQST